MPSVKPYKVFYKNEVKCFTVNPEYIELFKRLKIDSSNVFFKADPYFSGLHAEDSEDEPHSRFFENSDVNALIVKDSNTLKKQGLGDSRQIIENYLESLVVDTEYILNCIEELNDWAQNNYKEAYMKSLKKDILALRAEFM